MLAALALHNYLRLTSNAMYTPIGFVGSESGDGSIHGVTETFVAIEIA